MSWFSDWKNDVTGVTAEREERERQLRLVEEQRLAQEAQAQEQARLLAEEQERMRLAQEAKARQEAQDAALLQEQTRRKAEEDAKIQADTLAREEAKRQADIIAANELAARKKQEDDAALLKKQEDDRTEALRLQEEARRAEEVRRQNELLERRRQEELSGKLPTGGVEEDFVTNRNINVQEAERVERERLAREEAERVQTERDRLAAEEHARLQAELAERQRLERERIASEELIRQRDERERGRLADINTRRTGSLNAVRSGVGDYFRTRGADSTKYTSEIDKAIQDILSQQGAETTDFGTVFDNVASSVYDERQTARRSDAQNQLAQLFGTDFERSRIADTVDDQYIDEIAGRHRADADAIINNMLNRRVITDTGARAAFGRLDEQTGGVRGLLDQLGQGYLTRGRQDLTDVAGDARFNADALTLGGDWDSNVYSQRADEKTNDFLSRLGENFRGSIPEGNLFDTSGLAAAAGQGQGQQNLKFDPDALSGIIKDDGQDTTQKNNQTFNPNKKKKFGSGIF